MKTALQFAAFTIGLCVGLSVVLAWLYNSSGGSLFITILGHGSVNAGFAFAPTTALPTAVAFLAFAVAAVTVAVISHGRLAYQADVLLRRTGR